VFRTRISRRMRVAAAGLVLMAGAGVAQTPDPGEITGRTFQGVRLPLAVTPGVIEVAALKETPWTEAGARAADGAAAPAGQRSLLTGDVTARLGTYELTATRAVVWLSPLEAGDPDAGPGVWQVWVYMERGGSAVQAGGIRVTGDHLPVQGVIKT